jgi:hypothetical protein
MKSGLAKNLELLKNKLESFEKEYEEKLETVKQTEAKYVKIENKLEDFISEKDNTITLNIGGKKFLTKMSTLLKRKESLFHQLLNSYVSNNEEIPNEFFFDRSFKNFDTILDYIRTGQLNMKLFKNYEKQDIEEELEYYGLIEKSNKSKKISYELEWEKTNLKGCSVDPQDPKILRVTSNTCYTHFLTNRKFTDENFIVEFESNVTQTDNYFYFGIINENYSITGTCMCCNPSNSYYVQCDGNVHINSQINNISQLAWHSQTVRIGMKVLLKERQIYFYIPDIGNTGPIKFQMVTASL